MFNIHVLSDLQFFSLLFLTTPLDLFMLSLKPQCHNWLGLQLK